MRGTIVEVPLSGEYEVFVRTRDRAAPHGPGRFTLSIDGATLPVTFGADGPGWAWQSGDRISLRRGPNPLVLSDLTTAYGESYAPEVADGMHHGNTLFFRTGLGDHPVPFPDVPWATEVAKDYANLSGQLIRPGLENGPGPLVGENPPTPEFRFGRAADVFPATHFWEYGQRLDPYTSGEHVRDYLMRALYVTFANVKRRRQPDRQRRGILHPLRLSAR